MHAAVEARGHALVTGASAGIGAALARELARRGHPLILTARRADRLEALREELSKQVDCRVLVADLEDPEAPTQLLDAVAEQGIEVGLLVNNAGYGVPGTYGSVDWETHARFLQIMITAVCELSWRFLPQLQRNAGGVINVASLAGHVPGSAGHTLYAAAKSFMIKFSQSLALENAEHGMRVCALCPGFTYSEFHDVTGTRDQVSKMPDYMWMQAEDVVREGLDAWERGEIVWVPGKVNRVIKTLTALMPDRMALKLVAKRSKDFRKL
ncbi:SDR family NAD(P)-dependent oxidoreductase [Pseudomarimonas salicorniae]|uniref:SDR family oxidoreductase n=1 Tax=Pseudomarimonas salicorniae TaxID=2933270 RepID=A0ABT0GJG1_9GAMM|nr:SDR family oxidoreductase [Lysobacter sp. CAU 1642]MCK7594681.1 SDR family oxidoreductase [Lysobacter sp. CAU 1642]